jgi:hypothetical protein
MKAIKLALFVMVLALAMTPMALAATTTQVVTESDITRQPENTPPTNNWVLYTRNAGTGAFVAGPGTPPLGAGSLQLDTPTGADKVFLFNYDHIGTRLADINAISYSTYRTAGSLQQVTALNMEVDYNGPDVAGGFTTLVFEPVYNTDQGAVVDGQWQFWDAYNSGNAKWWSTKNIPGVCAFDCFVPWSAIVAANPDATILGGFGVNQGSGNPGLSAAVDALTFGAAGTTVTYDFELYHVATSMEQCKNGGWQNVTRADGASFRNQGDCMQYVNTGR